MTANGSMDDTVVVGAGIAGLACARVLARHGRRPIVFERSRGLGGRCATRRISGWPVDHGAAFVHGKDEGFLADARAAGVGGVLDGWPRIVEGRGAPCLPTAFEPSERRLAYAAGMTSLPKHIAQGLDVRRETPVVALSAEAGGILVHGDKGTLLRATSVVLAVPPPTALKLLKPMAGHGREAAAVCALTEMIGSQSCLTVLAGYPAGAPRPGWDVCYPDDSTVVQMISHDSAKRQAPGSVVLVIQARPCWSRARFDSDERVWTTALLQETARVVGGWAEQPSWAQGHRWRFARSDRGSALNRPLSVRLPGTGRVIVTGESFAPGGGIESAWLAGNAGARRVLDEE